MTHSDVHEAPERAIVEGVRRGSRTAEACTELALQALRDLDHLNVLVDAPMGSQALSQARAIDRARISGNPLGPLAGLPVVVKDNIAVAGQPLTGASPALVDHRPPHSAGSVRRLVDAGAVVVGRTNMHELAMGVTSDNAAHGPVRNPHDPARMAGGSSGGTAAAIAAGAVGAGLATDTGGSGRIPAAWCGTVGFRPSAGRYPAEGVLHIAATMDSVAVMTRSLDGLALLDGVLGDDVATPAPALDDLRLGVPHQGWIDVVPDVLAGCEEALERFRAAGATLVPVDLEEIHALDRAINLPLVAVEFVEFWSTFARDELGCELAALVSRLVSPDVSAVVGHLVSLPRPTAAQHAELYAGVRGIRDRFAQVFDGLGLHALVFPTVPVAAPHVGATTVQLPSGERDAFEALTAGQTPASLAGIPALTFPIARTRAGLPIGLELDGPAGHDRRLIAIAADLTELLVPDAEARP